MNRERLKYLIQVIEQVHKERRPFYMGAWASTFGRLVRRSAVNVPEDQMCGTAFCALGWAALDRQFRAEGLRLTITMPDGSERRPTLSRLPKNFSFARVEFDGYHDECAAQRLFGITYATADWLFTPSGYDSGSGTGRAVRPRRVIRRIKHLLAYGETCLSRTI